MSKEIEKDFMNDIMSKCELEVEPKDIAMLLYDIYDVPSGICEQVKTMVQRLESIDNSNPSEVLESLERLNYHTTLEYQDSKEYYIVRQYIHKAQEQDFNYNKIVIPFLNELVIILGINDIDEMLDKIKEQKRVLNIIKEKNIDIIFEKENITQEEIELVQRYCNG